MTRREREAEAARRYREMLAAVRSWVAVAHPGALMLDVVNGDGDILASFHAEPDDRYSLGVASGHRI